jgi:hypothetical protein
MVEIDYWDFPPRPAARCLQWGEDFLWAIEFDESVLNVLKILAGKGSHLS